MEKNYTLEEKDTGILWDLESIASDGSVVPIGKGIRNRKKHIETEKNSSEEKVFAHIFHDKRKNRYFLTYSSGDVKADEKRTKNYSDFPNGTYTEEQNRNNKILELHEGAELEIDNRKYKFKKGNDIIS